MKKNFIRNVSMITSADSENKIKISEKKHSNCQSCGMPLKKDEHGGGTNADGSKSNMYCSKCYQNGNFTRPDITMDQMKELVKGKLKEFGFPGFMAWIFTRNIPKLERWKK